MRPAFAGTMHNPVNSRAFSLIAMSADDTKIPSTPDIDSAAAPAETPVAKKDARASRSRTSPVVWLALLLAILSLGAALLVGWEQLALRSTPADIAASRATLNQLEERIADLDDDERTRSEQVAIHAATLERQQRALDELPLRIERMERAVEAVPGVAEEGRRTWMLAEAEYYLRVANAQVQLAANPVIAERALSLADEKLRDLEDPALTPVRARISEEITALRSVPPTDAAGVALALDTLAGSLRGLPLRQRSPDSFAPDTGDGTAEENWWQRLINSIKRALSSVISVRRSDVTVEPELDNASRALLMRAMELELQVAKLAYIRNEGELYRQSLDLVSAKITQHLDPAATATQSALGDLASLRALEIADSLPEVSGSLSLLLEISGTRR